MGLVVLFACFGEYPTVGLVLDIEKFGTVEPMSRTVLKGSAANGLRQGFAHHSARVPDRFYGRTVADGVTPDRLGIAASLQRSREATLSIVRSFLANAPAVAFGNDLYCFGDDPDDETVG